MTLLYRFKKFYNASEENQMQTHRILGFIVLPIIVLSLLYIVVSFLLLPA